MNLASSSYDTQDNNGIVIGGPVKTQQAVLDTGDLAAGTVLGRIDASQKVIAHDPDAVDGSQVACGILCHDADASSADVTVQMYVGGEFDLSKLTFNVDLDSDDKKRAIFDGTPIVLRRPL